MTANPIGEYLRARRELARPADAGIPVTARRRVPGLRRDELAMLAGISTEYYTRLEQGRDQHPSAQVLNAIARALGLDQDAVAHLHQLAAPRPAGRRPARARPAPVRPSLQQLLDSWPLTPAYVEGPHLDVLASNAIARALSPMFEPGTNVLRAIFLDPAVHDLFPDWEAKAPSLVAALRAMAGTDTGDPRLAELVGELSVRSETFSAIWSRHDIRPHIGGGTHRMVHPQVGELELPYDKFAVTVAADQVLMIYHAEPGSGTEQSLRLLSSLAAGTREGAARG
jgi:transcriptional regulator with XRE-family HTH domain